MFLYQFRPLMSGKTNFAAAEADEWRVMRMHGTYHAVDYDVDLYYLA